MMRDSSGCDHAYGICSCGWLESVTGRRCDSCGAGPAGIDDYYGASFADVIGVWCEECGTAGATAWRLSHGYTADGELARA